MFFCHIFQLQMMQLLCLDKRLQYQKNHSTTFTSLSLITSMISSQYQFDQHPYSLIHYKNCIFHGQVENSLKQNIGILFLDNGQVLIGKFLNDQLNGEALTFLNPETYVIGSFTRGMLDGRFLMRTPLMTVYWSTRMNKIQGEIIVINYETMTARSWIIQNGQGNCLKQVNIKQTDKENQILQMISSVAQPCGSCTEFLYEKFGKTLAIEYSALTQTTQISLLTNSTHKLKLTIFKEKLVQYGVYHEGQLNGLGYSIEGPNILQGRFRNGKLDGYGLKWEVQSGSFYFMLEKIISGSFKNGDIRTIDVITDNEVVTRKELKVYKRQQHIYSLEYCNNYFNERPILMLLNFLNTIQQNDTNFTSELQQQQSLSMKYKEKPSFRTEQKQKVSPQKNSQDRFEGTNKLNLSMYSRDKNSSKIQQNSDRLRKSVQPYQSRFKKVEENGGQVNQDIGFSEGINELNRINKALRKFK